MSKDKTPYEQLREKLQFFPRANQERNPISSPKEPGKPSLDWSFLSAYWKNFPQSVFFAFCTVPMEALILHRLLHYFNYPNTKPAPYSERIKELGWKNLYKGFLARIAYCAGGTLTTVTLLEATNGNWLLTTLLKNPLNLPFSLFSNARQTGSSVSDSLHFVRRGVLDPVVNASFLARNGAGNLCWAFGLEIRDRLYHGMGESNTQIPTAAGILTGGATATLMNAWLKSFFTGKYPFAIKLAAANALIKDCWPLGVREFASTSIFFFNKPFPKKPDNEAENEAKMPPSL